MSISKIAIALIAFSGSSASAFEFIGSDVRASETNYSDSFSSADLSANLAFKFDDKFSVQVGAAMAHEAGGTAPYQWSLDSKYLEAHLGYALSPEITIGGFVGRTYDSGSLRFSYYGLETKISVDKLELNVALNKRSGDDGFFKSNSIFVDGSYSISEKLAILAGVQLRSSEINFGSAHSTTSYNRSYIGAEYEVIPNLTASFSVGKNSPYNETISSIGLTYKFGKGKIFDERG